jgi:hypothetical protein
MTSEGPTGSEGQTGPQGFVLQYPELVSVNLLNQAINFADLDLLGHRIQIPIPLSQLQSLFMWQRTAEDSEPKGLVTEVAEVVNLLIQNLSNLHHDLDQDPQGLSFSSDVLTRINDERLRPNNQRSANDIVMSFVLAKLYGKTNIQTKDYIFNPEDAHMMLTNEALAFAIGLSLYSDAGKDAIQEMFRQLVEKDPSRFYDENGFLPQELTSTLTGLEGSGPWNLIPNDCIEIRTECIFHSPITRRDLEGSTVVIPPGTTFRIRLQLLAIPDLSWSSMINGALETTTTSVSRIAATGEPEITRYISDQQFSTGEFRFRPASSTIDAYVGLIDSSGNFTSGFTFTPTGSLTGLTTAYTTTSCCSIHFTYSQVELRINDEIVSTETASGPFQLCISLRQQGDMIEDMFLFPV